MATASLALNVRLRWWFKPWKLGVLAFVAITGRAPTDEWIGKWVRRAVFLEVKS